MTTGDLIPIILPAALTGEFIIPYTLAFHYPGYNHKKMVMSILGSRNSPVRKIYNTWLILLGIILLWASFQFYHQYNGISQALSLSGAIILATYSIGGCILSGIFSVNETKSLETIPEKIHGIGAGTGFIFLLFLPLIISLLYFKIQQLIPGIICLILFVAAVVFFVLFVVSEREKFQTTAIGYTGLWQRLQLGCMYLPLLMISVMN